MSVLDTLALLLLGISQIILCIGNAKMVKENNRRFVQLEEFMTEHICKETRDEAKKKLS